MALLGSFLLDSAVAVLLLLFIAWRFGTAEYKHFKKRGIPYLCPLPLIGNFDQVLLGRTPLSHAWTPLYQRLKPHKYGIIFEGLTPTVLLCDPELARMALIKDFSSLHDRGTAFDEKNDPLSGNLFNMPSVRWKNLRSKLSPVFTSGKLKQMFPLMVECSQELSQVLRDEIAKNEVVQVRDILGRYVTDVIGTCAFGIACNSLQNPDSEFYKASVRFLTPSVLTTLRFSVFANSELISKLLPFKKMFPDYYEFFINLMADTIKHRKDHKEQRNDFVQMMMQLQDNDENKTEETHPDEVIFTDKVIAAQAFFFFVAGQDALANSVGFALHHLSLDTRLQDDLADEVHSVINQHNQEITYAGLKEMKFLEMVVNEALRMYPPGGFVFRQLNAQSYTFPETDFTIEKGMKVTIPLHAFHTDPDYFPEPERFDPYRFTEEAVSKRHPCVFLPFGEGPRVCIANRFAMLEMKHCLASLIKDFTFSVCSETQIPIKLKSFTFAVAPTKGFMLRVQERK